LSADAANNIRKLYLWWRLFIFGILSRWFLTQTATK